MPVPLKLFALETLKMPSSMRLVKITRILFFLSVLFLFFSCGKKNEETLVLTPITLSAEGPYFEGPNSFQGNIGSDLNDFLQKKGYQQEQLKDLKIVKASVLLDSLAQNIEDLTLQVVSEKESMQKLAFINPLPKGKESIELSVAQEQQILASYFLDGGTLILDANFLKEMETNISFEVKLELQLTIKN